MANELHLAASLVDITQTGCYV